MLKDYIKKITSIFRSETVTIDELRELKQYAILERKFYLLEKDYNALNADYTELKGVLFSPLYVPSSEQSKLTMTYIMIGAILINIVITLMK